MKSCKCCVSAVTWAAAFLVLIAVCGTASAVPLLSQNFDGVTPSALPAGWNSAAIVNAGSAWVTAAEIQHPPTGVQPVSAPNLVYFNSYTVVAGGSARLYYAVGLDTTPYLSLSISFQMYHDPGWPDSNDRVQVQVSTDGDTWVNVGAPISRLSDIAAWQRHEVNLDAYLDLPSVRVGLLGLGAYGNDCNVDDIVVSGVLPNMCSPTEGKWTDTLTISGSGFGETQGGVSLNDDEIEVLSWTAESIQCRIDTPLAPGLKDVIVTPAAGGDPITLTDAFTVLSSCTPSDGTVGTLIQIDGEGFGDTKGKVALQFGDDKPIALKVTTWTPAEITCALSKLTGFGTFDVVIAPKTGEPITLPESFQLKTISVDAPAPDHGPAATAVTLAARYHGTKKGKAYLFLDTGAKPLMKTCKVDSWLMDPATNAGTIQLTIPKGLPGDVYDLIVVGPGGADLALPAAFTYETQ